MSVETILVVDDSTDIRTIVKYALLDQGFRVLEAPNGFEAIRLARQWQPTAILLDLCMPGIDGWEVTLQLRSDPALDEVPIIAMTAYDVAPAICTAKKVGCQHVVAKPFDLYEITQTIKRFLSNRLELTVRYAGC